MARRAIQLMTVVAMAAAVAIAISISRGRGPGAEDADGVSVNVEASQMTPAERLGLPADTPVKLKQRWRIEDFERPLAQFESVFWEPDDTRSLRALIRQSDLVQGKTVLEIGAGTGLLSLCCLRAGAAKVVATDINPSALANTAYNADELDLDERLSLRLVHLERPGAFEVVKPGERFDLIISNPPWVDRRPATMAARAFDDEGFKLLRSILKDLREHLRPNGKALIAYGCVSAIKEAKKLAQEYSLQLRVLDDRRLEDLPEEFLPGMLLEISP